ncbi:MAG: heparinase II/III family protein [Armatimonadota bacterium]|nr:heparinase II/III family protein [Armatimonadota bacterium]
MPSLGSTPRLTPALMVAAICSLPAAHAADVLRVEEVLLPERAPAGATVPIAARFSVVEPLRDGWRVGVDLTPAGEGRRITHGPVGALFGPADELGVTKRALYRVPIPEDAAPGTYRVTVDHYDKREGQWVHVRYVDEEGSNLSTVLGEIEIIPPLPERPPNPPQRRLKPGEVHRVYECEDFEGMDGRGEDLSLADGWMWYSRVTHSRLRAAVNTSGEGEIWTQVDPPLPPGSYKLFARAGNTFWIGRVRLGEASMQFTPLRSGWNEIGVVEVAQPVSRLALEIVQRIDDYAIVDALYVTNDLSTEACAGLDPSRQYLPVDARPVKDERTIYTERYMAGVRQRMQQHPSVREAAENIIAEAREIASHSDRELWELLAPSTIRRTYYVNQNAGCPICGLKIKEVSAFHPWILEPFEHPYKMQCPVCKRRFPTNDFAAGEMTGGEYPDDGTGCTIDGETYYFLGEYTHWVYRTYFSPYLRTLAQAVALTDDRELAHKLSVMLLRGAQQWSNSEDRYQRSFEQRVGHRAGAITDRIWSSYEGRNYGWAYDAVFPFLDDDDELLALAREEIPQIQTHEDLRLYIEESLLRRIGQQYCDTAIQGNAGYHHRGIAWLLLALDDPDSERFPNCRDLLDFLYYRIYGALRYFANLIASDGSSFESTGYNASRLNMVEALDVLERYFAEQAPGLPRDRYPSLWDDPRFAAQFDYYTDYLLLDRWLPTIGDVGGNTVIPEHTEPQRLSVVGRDRAAQAWERYRNLPLAAKLARVAYGLEDRPPEPSLWSDLPLEELAKAREAAPDMLPRRTQVQDDYGLAFLRSGEGESRRVLWAWYGQLLSHAHSDSLLCGLAGRGLDLLPDLGYPKSWEHAGRWESHSLTHNTITVDGGKFPPGKQRGRLRALGTVPPDAILDGTPLLQFAQTETGDLTGEADVARRMLALVDIDEDDFYAVDLFDVRAGSEHVLSYHGPQAEVRVEGVELEAQETGTVAGPDVGYGEAVQSDGEERHTPLAHMTQVQRGEPAERFIIDYALGDEADTHVRLHQFPEAGASLALATGRPPSQPDAYRVRYSLLTRAGEAPLRGRYLTVVEPYLRQPALSQCSRLAGREFGEPQALRISHDRGADLLLLLPEAGREISGAGVEFRGRAALVRFAGGEPVAVTAYEFSHLDGPGFSLRADALAIEGEIAACDYAEQTVTAPGLPADERLVGQHVRIFNDLHSTMHRIVEVAQGRDGTRLQLSTSALRHEGWVAGVGQASVRDGAPSPWALGTFLAGTRLVNEDGTRSWTVRDAAGGWHSAPSGTRISLVPGPQVNAELLDKALVDANGDGSAGFRLCEYGAGDRLAIATWALLRRADDGTWRAVLSPTVSFEAH